MIEYLLDANVVSESMRAQPSERVAAWLARHEEQCAIDSMVVGEIYVGILALPAGRKRAALRTWFDGVVAQMICIPWDSAAAVRWAELIIGLRKKGRSMPLHDSVIAATALTHGLTIVTRNTQDFKYSGANVIDPFMN